MDDIVKIGEDHNWDRAGEKAMSPGNRERHMSVVDFTLRLGDSFRNIFIFVLPTHSPSHPISVKSVSSTSILIPVSAVMTDMAPPPKYRYFTTNDEVSRRSILYDPEKPQGIPEPERRQLLKYTFTI